MPQARPNCLRAFLHASPGDLAGRVLVALDRTVRLSQCVFGTSLGGRAAELAGRSVLLVTDGQLASALALIELDGVARRIVIAPPDLKPEYLAPLAGEAEVEAIVSNRDPADFAALGTPVIGCGVPIEAGAPQPDHGSSTEWVLLTSGTTGVPKMVVHDLAGLTAAIRNGPPRERPLIWGTFYDIRRYGGLQIFLRAVAGSGSLILSEAGEPVVDHLRRLAANGVTHVSGTPSHWRRALMCTEAGAIAPEYVRLSGEIADQAILDALRALYPDAVVGHAYASTEAGVGFEVDDGREGFPASFIHRPGDVRMKVEDGSLRISSNRMASRYLGAGPLLADGDGFVDTGDMVELRGDRYFFVGRRGGIINVGGLKVHPEEIEAVINRHQSVRASFVKARRSPIMGAIVVADVVLNDAVAGKARAEDNVLKNEILRLCRAALPQHKVPASIRFVASVDVTAAGKLARHDA